MALFLRQDEQRSELQNRVATELQERLKHKTEIEHKTVDPAFLEGQHTTRKAGMIIIVLIVILVIALIIFALRIS